MEWHGERYRATLRAKRIAQGLDQGDLAYMLGCDTDKKIIAAFENPKSRMKPSNGQELRMKGLFDGFMRDVKEAAETIERTGEAYLWRSQDERESAGKVGSFERRNLKVVLAAVCLEVEGKLSFDDIKWRYWENSDGAYGPYE